MRILFGKRLESLYTELDYYRSRVDTLIAEKVLLQGQFDREYNERVETKEILYNRIGLSSTPQVNTREMRPIGRGVVNWPGLRRKLEANSKIPKNPVVSQEEQEAIAKTVKTYEEELGINAN